MLNRLYPLLLLLAALPISAQTYQRVSGFCTAGAVQGSVLHTQSVVTPQSQSAYPGCAVQVFATGTQTPVQLFSDSNGTALAQPFTADTRSGYWFFYTTQTGVVLDVNLSGAGFPAPVTYPFQLGGSGGSSIPLPVSIANGGTGTSTPQGVIQGSGVIVTGAFPNQIVSATGGGGGTVTMGGTAIGGSSSNATLLYFKTVIDSGADPTGTADSSAAFRAAVAAAATNGNRVYIPCGNYLLSSSVGQSAFSISTTNISLTGQAESCVNLIHATGSTGSVFNYNMVPFTTDPAGEISGFRVTCTSTTQYGIDTGQVVGAWIHNVDVSGCTAPTSRAWRLHNLGNVTTWTERNHWGPQVSAGAYGTLRNSHGMYLEADNSNDSWGYNNFEDIKFNVTTGQEGFTLASGFFYNIPQFNMVVNMDNGLAGTVGPIAIRSSSNWDSVNLHVNGEYNSSGPGTGTAYRVQVDSGARFSNFTGSVINIFAPGGAQVADNILAAPVSSPNVTLVQGPVVTDWGMGTYTLSGVPVTPQPIKRFNYGSMGLLLGNNIESPYVSMFQGTGNKFPIITVPTGGILGPNGIEVASINLFGGFSGAFWIGQCNTLLSAGCVPPGSTDGNVHQALAGFTGGHRSGLSNTYFQTQVGVNESMTGDPNFSGGWGFVEGTNISHDLAWCYSLDPTCFEMREKTFQTPLGGSPTTWFIGHGGTENLGGHVNQLTANQNVAGTCSVSAGTSCSFNFSANFNSKPICTHSLEFDLVGTGATYHVTPTTSSCTITFSVAQTGVTDFIVVGNPN